MISSIYHIKYSVRNSLDKHKKFNRIYSPLLNEELSNYVLCLIKTICLGAYVHGPTKFLLQVSYPFIFS